MVSTLLNTTDDDRLLQILREDDQWWETHRILRYFPDGGPLRRELYAKHMEFFRAGARYPLRLMLKGNRVGGTEGFGCELTYHLTGDYPSWWEGYRFDHPIVAWAAGDTNPKTQEIIQAKLFGTKDARLTSKVGTGIIPGDTITGVTMRTGVPGAIETARIAYKTGGESVLTLKSFEQGVESFQGNEIHVIWLDELAPLAILAECIVRLTPTTWFEGGILAWTVTPEEGMTDAILEFLPDGQVPDGEQQPPKFVMLIGWDDVPHLSDVAKRTLEAGIPAYQLDARKRGIPMLGSGVIYPIAEDDYCIDPFELPPHFRRAYGMDVGWNRTAVLWGAYDPDNDIWYVYNEHYRGQAEPSVHAAAIKGRGEWIPGVIDPAARGRSQRDGYQLLHGYIHDYGLILTTANNAVEAGIYQVWERLSSGRLKVFRSLSNLRKEMRLYRRDEKGRIVKTDDHLCDALRYLIMSGGDVATPVPVPKSRLEDEDDEERLMVGRRSSAAWMG